MANLRLPVIHSMDDDLRNPDGIRIVRAPPGEVAGMRRKPAKQGRGQVLNVAFVQGRESGGQGWFGQGGSKS